MHTRHGSTSGVHADTVVIARLPWDFTGLLASGAPHPRDLIWPLRHLYTAAILKRHGYRTVVIDSQLRYLPAQDLARQIAGHAPGTLILDVNTPDIPYALRLGEIVKSQVPETQIWATGQHPSYSAAELLPPRSLIDGCVAGHLFDSILPIVTRRPPREIPGSSVLVSGAIATVPPAPDDFNPDDLPQIDPELLDLPAYRLHSVHVPSFVPLRWGFLQTSWGCPFGCRFCSQTLRVSSGAVWRGQSPERVVADIERYVRDYDLRAFYLSDDVVTMDRGRILEICELLVARGVKAHWIFQTHLHCLDAGMLPALKRAGCVGIKFGVESGDPDVLARMDKHLSLDDAVTMAHAIRRAGIALTTYYMIGFPGETRAQMERTFRIARRIGSEMIQVAIYTPYPTSQGFAMLSPTVQRELLDYPQRFSHYNSFLPINLSAIDDEDLLDFQRDFYLRYYLSPPQLYRYVSRRAIYTIPQGLDGKLMIRAMSYLLNRAS